MVDLLTHQLPQVGRQVPSAVVAALHGVEDHIAVVERHLSVLGTDQFLDIRNEQ